MNGLWKENIGGWNTKDTKRKRQTYNHKLKDNGAYVITKFDGWRNKNKKVNSDVFRVETETEIHYEGSRYVDNTPIYEVEAMLGYVTYPEVDADGELVKSERAYSGFEEVTRRVTVYKDENKYYYSYHGSDDKYVVKKSGKTVAEHFKLNKKQAWKVKFWDLRKTNVLVKLDVTKALERRKETHVDDFDNDGDFIYGKPLASWKRMTFFGDGKRRKYAQKKANRADRRNIRNWIDNHDISKEVKTHALSKSILWEIW